MKYSAFYQMELKALAESVSAKPYDKRAERPLHNFTKNLSSSDSRMLPLTANSLADWVNHHLIKTAAFEAVDAGRFQALTDTLLASVIAFDVKEFLNAAEPPRFYPEDLFRAFCFSYALGYNKGTRFLLERFLASGFFDNGTYYWSPDSLHPDYLAFAFNFISSYQKERLVISRPGSRYDQLFDGRCGDENTINQLCQLHLLLAKGEKGTADLESPFGNLADTLMPYEILAYRKLYEHCYGELLPVEGDAVCLMEPWLESRFENRLEDRTCMTMVSALSQKLGKDFLAEALD